MSNFCPHNCPNKVEQYCQIEHGNNLLMFKLRQVSVYEKLLEIGPLGKAVKFKTTLFRAHSDCVNVENLLDLDGALEEL